MGKRADRLAAEVERLEAELIDRDAQLKRERDLAITLASRLESENAEQREVRTRARFNADNERFGAGLSTPPVPAPYAPPPAPQGVAAWAPGLLSRIAGALRVQRWDQDGTEILMRCQQWAQFSRWIARRQRAATDPAVAGELATLYAALIGPPHLAEWLSEDTGTVLPAALHVAESGAVATGKHVITRDDLHSLLAGQRDNWWLGSALKTLRGTNALLSFLNLVLVPLLEQLEAVHG